VAAVSAALRQAGAEVTAVDDLEKLDAALAGISPGSLDCYVQLPVQLRARGGTVTERVRNFLADGLLARFATASAILPVEASEPDDHKARLALLDVLAHAIQADKQATRIEVRVLPHDDPAERIAAVALRADLTVEPKMSFDEWRVEVMGLVNGSF